MVGFLLAASPSIAIAQSPVVGVASVIDGDTLEIHGQRIRLHGIDAPESGQSCERDGRQYRCGQQAALALADKVGRETVRCAQLDIDSYQRIVAVCRLGNLDLSAWMVRQGLAIAYRQFALDYVDDENAAQGDRAGMWAGRFEVPANWRRGEVLESENEPTPDFCQIKGNINRNGERIYHVPGARDYGPTRIDESKGERWFCSEDEALKAGWRSSAQ